MSSSQGESLQERLERAAAFKNEGQYEAALAEFRSILDDDPTNVEARVGVGLVLCFTGEFDASLEELRRAAADGPDSVDARLNLAKTYAMLGMYDEAKDEFNQVLRLSPGHKEAMKQLAFFEPSTSGEGGL
ncbi:MAG: tetratricopeptide repeat protein [Armatimonadetes bacterium]|nr:tetratricopeptide repeat protein [Armatimonadota bacterium]NIM23775.1 tetratricopeptide repeat protein [Armatimonadota bacterium]NIM67652.1 tetratricopeptide repeat protein [Armatimonadota bacterium]NIM76168.1 tetratricopeptide repeat protein [Armatimonadota bacterium]NIN05853.1 tetratricopeptide repeat protein [Armatimonadota bacterium]